MTDCREAFKAFNAAIIKFNAACEDESSNKAVACRELNATLAEIGAANAPNQ